MIDIRRGDIVLANLPKELCVQGGIRPAIVIQNDTGNGFSPTTIIVPLTSEIKKVNMPVHEIVRTEDASGLNVDSMALCEQIRTIDKRKIKKILGKIHDDAVLEKVSMACKISLDLV